MTEPHHPSVALPRAPRYNGFMSTDGKNDETFERRCDLPSPLSDDFRAAPTRLTRVRPLPPAWDDSWTPPVLAPEEDWPLPALVPQGHVDDLAAGLAFDAASRRVIALAEESRRTGDWSWVEIVEAGFLP